MTHSAYGMNDVRNKVDHTIGKLLLFSISSRVGSFASPFKFGQSKKGEGDMAKSLTIVVTSPVEFSKG